MNAENYETLGNLSALAGHSSAVFDRATSCREPVLTRLNDRPDFLRVFRKASRTDQ
jgi:hypothetical protein